VRLDPDSPHRVSAESHVADLAEQCERKTEPPPTSSSAAAPAPASEPPKDAGVITAPEVDAVVPSRRPATQRTVAIGLVTAGLALAGAAAALHVWNDGRFDAWQDEDRAIDEAPSGAKLRDRQAANNARLSDIRRIDVISAALAVAAGTSLVAGGTLFLTWHPASTPTGTGGFRLSWTASW
jgi:hypothetical protein